MALYSVFGSWSIFCHLQRGCGICDCCFASDVLFYWLIDILYILADRLTIMNSSFMPFLVPIYSFYFVATLGFLSLASFTWVIYVNLFVLEICSGNALLIKQHCEHHYLTSCASHWSIGLSDANTICFHFFFGSLLEIYSKDNI